MASRPQSLRVAAALVAATLLCTACASVPPVQLAFALDRDGELTSRPSPCEDHSEPASPASAGASLPGPRLRVLSWNLHRNGDPGWESDLVRYAEESDLLLIQEAALTAALRRSLATAGFTWLLAGSFTLDGTETGVLSAARVAPIAACVQRAFEPLLQLPKATLIARYALGGPDAALAVANLHAINFTLGMAEYRAQLDALARELARHRGPLIVGGDFNTWSDARLEAMHDVMRGLGLEAVLPQADTRTRVLGRQIDFVFVRGLEVVAAQAPQVGSSDHNPVLARLRVPSR